MVKLVIFGILIFLSTTFVVGDDSIPFDHLFLVNFTAFHEKVKGIIGDSKEAQDVYLKMVDASTKIPNGVLGGNFFDLGSFDECYNLEYETIAGKYCLGQITVLPPSEPTNIEPRLIGMGNLYAGFHFALCAPSSMTTDEMNSVANMKFIDEFCYSKQSEPDLSTGAIITIVVISVVVALSVFSTIYDIVIYYSKKKPHHELLIAFSFVTNGRKIFNSSTNSEQLLCLNGIKAFSMIWVVIGHVYSLGENSTVANFSDFYEWASHKSNMFLLGATVTVDSFFVVGGIVTVYTYLKAIDKGVKFNILMYYIHRYLRLTPAVAMMAIIHANLFPYFGNGPLWKEVDMVLVAPCRTEWWRTVFYVANFWDRQYCVPQTWYLSVDMQLFVLSPLILIPLVKWRKATLYALAVLILAGCIVPFAIGYSMDLSSQFLDGRYMNSYYYQTYTRFGPYVIGMAVGYVIYEVKKQKTKLRLHKYTVFLLWIIALVGITACVYSGHGLLFTRKKQVLENALFNAFDRPAWALSVSIAIFLCVTGYGGPVDSFLSLPILQIISKISYSMYLVHFSIITIRYATVKTMFQFSNIQMAHTFWGDFMFSSILATILCLTCESPIIILEKYLFGRGNTQKKNEPK